MNFVKFSRTPFSQNTSGRLLLQFLRKDMKVNENAKLSYRLLLVIFYNLTTIDFCYCFIQDDRVLKLFNTFTSEDQLLTNLLLIKKVCM